MMTTFIKINKDKNSDLYNYCINTCDVIYLNYNNYMIYHNISIIDGYMIFGVMIKSPTNKSLVNLIKESLVNLNLNSDSIIVELCNSLDSSNLENVYRKKIRKKKLHIMLNE